MSTEENKALIRRYLDETWNKGNVAVLDEVCAQDCFADSGGTLPQVKEYVLEFRKAVPDFRLHMDEMIAEGDTVATRWRWTGTNAEPASNPKLGQMPPVGKAFSVAGITFNHVASGKIISDIYVTHWTDMKIEMGINPMLVEKPA